MRRENRVAIKGQGPGWLQGVLARLRGGPAVDPTGLPLPPARLRRHRGYVSLQFVRGQTQSRMAAGDPDRLLVDYTRSMLAALLWQPRPARIGIVGLGGGSQVKFLHRHVAQARLEVVENHPGVIALRRDFGIPDDHARLEVVLDDGARFIAARPGRYEVLLVDGYDAAGIPPALSTPAFHAACRDALVPGGVMASNLHGDDPEPRIRRLRDAFGADRVLVVEEEKMSNRVAFAWTGAAPDGGDACIAAVDAALTGEARRELAVAIERIAQALRRRGAGPCAN
ncbi:transferase [Luteimonas sp. MC1750]|uniref:spermine/spermidine synthase domain-containing protein n=1 Tax=Luteimonas sp. MC1750 TaxID=2799326 RepID=UPI0018F0CDE4|nr:transferase [Luteimonas sp. MC1750]MBJ6984449.1 transferase [Luteimonas sp. MC1750]QQO04936.1 transferase [Luteimonas sp. MC1750]